MENQYSRLELLIGENAVANIRQSKVAVFGVGGVGGYVVEVLARSGVGSICIIDNDKVNITNINRQIIALHSTIGEYKVDALEKRILDINPDCNVIKHKMFYLPDNADEIDLTGYDYVIDCIDTVAAKIELIKRCKSLSIPIICSMGTANKMNPLAFRITDLSKTNIDPLARVLRKKLRKIGITSLDVLYSEEQPQRLGNETLIDENTHPTPASNAFVPAAAGLIIGGEVVKRLMARG